MAGESQLKQDLGPKKYKKLVEDNSKFYDKYKAGKKDPVTGEYYHHISGKNPYAGKSTGGAPLGYIQCIKCDNYFPVTRTTSVVICGSCKKLNKISINSETGEIETNE